ncbi:MAG: T3SS effector HopA1 family protein [Candidatus Phosphoribacter sp.]
MGVLSPAHHAQLERAVEVALPHLAAGPDAADLARFLYGQWYAAPARPRGLGGQTDPVEQADLVGQAELVGQADLVEQADPVDLPLGAVLRAGHPDTHRWESAVVERTGIGGTLVVTTVGGGIRAVARGDYAPATTARIGVACAVGDVVDIRCRTGGFVEGGWWRTWRGDWTPTRMPAALTRLYLSPVPRAVDALVPTVLAVLGRLDDPWLVKIGAKRAMLNRPDAMVAYLPDATTGLLDGVPSPVVRELIDSVKGLVDGTGPPLSDPLARGVSWVQDPGIGSSFGEFICGVLAAALVAHQPLQDAPPPGIAELAQMLAQALAAAGIDPGAPHLRPTTTEAA